MDDGSAWGKHRTVDRPSTQTPRHPSTLLGLSGRLFLPACPMLRCNAMGTLRMGTCSWRYPSWEGLVYSAAKGIDELAEYASRYDCVEVDRWFWSLFEPGQLRLPERRDAAAYRASVPDSFRFAVKAPNSLTLPFHHRKRKADPAIVNPHFLSPGVAAEFLDRIAPLHDLLGPVMFQFEYLNRDKMASRQAFEKSFGAFARKLPSGFVYGLEIRNARWLDADFLAFIQSIGMIPVLISGYWMPPLPDLLRTHADRIAAFDTIVIRLMGRDRAAIEAATGKVWNRIVDPQDAELDALAPILQTWSQSGPSPFLFINNHYEGSAPLTLERIRQRLGIGRGTE